ncbi:RHS repeat-associated core domain-containing protein [Providencia sp. Me31A]|uniref:RHS repeat-associated core domain-containing protein n=1 Tax=Providencia sp. Me31A TaxID=3392637 RepID=UPI003D2D6725
MKKVVGNKNGDYCVVSSGPDVCKVGNSVVPFDSYQQLSSEQSYVKSVRVNGVPTLTVGSIIKGTQSNAGSGIISGTSQGSGDCIITSGSPTVRFCGNAAAYHGSDVLMNNGNVPGLLYTVEKVLDIAKEAALIDGDNITGSVDSKSNSYFKSIVSTISDINDAQNMMTIGVMSQLYNNRASDIEFFAEQFNKSSAASIQSAAYGPATWGMSKEGKAEYNKAVMGVAQGIREKENPIKIPRVEIDEGFEQVGATAETAAELVTGVAAVAKWFKTGVKALPRFFKKEAPTTKNTTLATPPKNEQIVSTNKPDGPASSAVCKLDPVNVATGDFIQVWPVLSLPGLLPVQLQRSYRSTASQTGLFGAKWADNWSTRIDITTGELVYWNEEGTSITYPVHSESLNIRHSHYAHALLSGELDGEITLFDNRTQLTQHFNHLDGQIRRLSAITDNNQQRIDFHYDDEHRLTLITRNGQALLRLEYQQHQLQTISLVDSAMTQPLVTCQYDEQGYLSECDAFQQNHLWHEYSPEGYMTRWYDTDQTDYYLEYDEQGRAVRNHSPSGYWCGGFIYDDIHRMTTFYDNEGGQSYYYYNDAGLVTHAIDALGRETVTEWENNLKISETNALGETTRYLYHYDGNLAQVIYPDERSVEYHYNARGQLIEMVSPTHDTWQLDYDPQGNLTTLTDPQGQTQTYEYSQHGELLKAIQPNGAQWQYEYNDSHQLIKTTNPYKNSTEYQFDELGRLQEYTDALKHTTRYRYSSEHAGVNGSVSDILLPDDAHQHIEYDSERRVVAVTDGEGKITRYRYGPFDLLLAMVRPDGTEIQFEYDSLTRLKAVINATGERYTYERDIAGQIIRETDFTGRIQEYRYDRLGRRTATRYPDNHELRWRYDVSGLITEQSEWLDNGIENKCLSVTTYEYNARLQLVKATNPDSVVEFDYDAQGRLTCERINGQEIKHDWDSDHSTLTRTAFGDRELHYAFGQLGELTSLQINQHAPLQYSYNAVGQEYLRRSEAGFVNSSHYTATGLLAHQRAGRGSEHFLQSLQHNPHQPPFCTDVHRSYQYDRAHNVVGIEDDRWKQTTYRYNANDQITEAQYSNQIGNRDEKFLYDANLNLTEHMTLPSDAQGAMLQLFQQQQAGRVTRRDTARGYQLYHYDVNGRLEKKIVHEQGYRPREWRYLWNTQNQLTACFTPKGDCWRYTYDAFGRRLSKTQTVDSQAAHVNPRFPQLKPKVTAWHYLWSGDQMVEETPIYADGTPAYDSQIQWLYEPGAVTPTARYQNGKLHYVVTDHQGTPREIFTEAGRASWAGRLNTWGQMQFWQSRDGLADNDPTYTECHFRFAGQYEDRETGLYYNRFRYYDKDNGQYISPDPIGLLGGLNPYGYVHCPVGFIDPFGLAGDCCNELTGTLKSSPKTNPPKPHQLEAMNKAINDIFNGKGIPRIDRQTGTQTIFQGRGNAAQARWKGASEWEVIPGNNDLRILTKDLGNGKTQVGFSNDHYDRIFDVIIKKTE